MIENQRRKFLKNTVYGGLGISLSRFVTRKKKGQSNTGQSKGGSQKVERI